MSLLSKYKGEYCFLFSKAVKPQVHSLGDIHVHKNYTKKSILRMCLLFSFCQDKCY